MVHKINKKLLISISILILISIILIPTGIIGKVIGEFRVQATVISGPMTISTPGVYVINGVQSFNDSGDFISIQSNDVIIDGQGNTITYTGTSMKYAFQADAQSNITIKNLYIEGNGELFGLDFTLVNLTTIENVTFNNCDRALNFNGVNDLIFVNNQILNNYDYLFFIDGTLNNNINISHNIFDGMDQDTYGVNFWSDLTNSYLMYNNFNNMYEAISLNSDAIDSINNGGFTISYNNFANNYAAFSMGGLNSVNVSYNYWGTTECTEVALDYNSPELFNISPILDAPYSTGIPVDCDYAQKTEHLQGTNFEANGEAQTNGQIIAYWDDNYYPHYYNIITETSVDTGIEGTFALSEDYLAIGDWDAPSYSVYNLKYVNLSDDTITDTGITISDWWAYIAMQHDDDKIAFISDESASGDINNDSDTSDLVMAVYDISENSVEYLDVASETGNWPIAAVHMNYDVVVWPVLESDTNSDRNSDGDTTDYVLSYYDIEDDIQGYIPLTIASDLDDFKTGFDVAGEIIYINVPEWETNNDTTADGDTDDYIIYKFNITSTSLTIFDSLELIPNGDRYASTFAQGPQFIAANNLYIGYFEDEYEMAGVDLDHNGDDREQVFYIYYKSTGERVNTKIPLVAESGSDRTILDVFDTNIIIETCEDDINLDLNGDSSITSDCFVSYYELPHDIDEDTIMSPDDNCPYIYNKNQRDSDNDEVGDVCDNCENDANTNQSNLDNDNLGDVCDNCPNVTNQDQQNNDTDSYGDACDNCMYIDNENQTDQDVDSVGDLCDNCIYDTNTDQNNSDTDSFGNVCDNCIYYDNEDQLDNDSDSIGNVCDNCIYDINLNQDDQDNDTIGDTCDNCISDPNPDQSNIDGDRNGDACDSDDDDDGIPDTSDNLIGDSSTITNNFNTINFTVNNSDNLSQEFIGVNEINIDEDGITRITFNYNFSESPLDLSDLNITKQDAGSSYGSIIIQGLNLTGDETKTVYIDKIASKDRVCILDQEGIASVSQVSTKCDTPPETQLRCPETLGQYVCSIEGNYYKITGLNNSAVTEYDSEEETTTTSSSSRRSSSPSCIWSCTDWTECQPDNGQTRTCGTDDPQCDNLEPYTQRKSCVYTAPIVKDEPEEIIEEIEDELGGDIDKEITPEDEEVIIPEEKEPIIEQPTIIKEQKIDDNILYILSIAILVIITITLIILMFEKLTVKFIKVQRAIEIKPEKTRVQKTKKGNHEKIEKQIKKIGVKKQRIVKEKD
ncbi:hypothetical protein ACFL1H_05775, partial [Nanoarchaeota archaeon]